MASTGKSHVAHKKKNKVFISWSGKSSKAIAKELKFCLESIFSNAGLEFFVSDLSILSGTDWWNAINKELTTSGLGILCITKDNILAPWIYFEAGAMVARSVNTIPLLVNCSFDLLDHTPLNQKQAIDFYDQNKFEKMLLDIREIFSIPQMTSEQICILGKAKYEEMRAKLAPTLSELKQLRRFNEKYVYPNSIKHVRVNTIYVGAPMASILEDEYDNLHEILGEISVALQKIGFTSVYCPLTNIASQKNFDGKTKAISENFPKMKECDSMLIIYPRKIPSSVLVELGYGIALSKKTLICYKEDLPYMVQEAGEEIKFVKTHRYNDLREIKKYILDNGMSLFKEDADE